LSGINQYFAWVDKPLSNLEQTSNFFSRQYCPNFITELRHTNDYYLPDKVAPTLSVFQGKNDKENPRQNTKDFVGVRPTKVLELVSTRDPTVMTNLGITTP
jgi:hypothetical protein